MCLDDMDFVDNAPWRSHASKLTSKHKKYFEIGSCEKSSDYKKLNKSLVCRTHPLLTLSNRASPSFIDKRLCNYVALIQNNVIRMENDVTASDCPTDYCGFPYYSVLMKDIGISCNLEIEANQDFLTLSALEKFFLKQLKNEYQDLSDITKKISAYTKDKFQTLSKKYKKRYSNDLEKQPVATEYIDKNGNICLKLRLKDFQSEIKEENTLKSIISSFINSWNFLSSLQQRTDNVRKERKEIVKSPRKSCFSIHKKNYRKDKKEKTLRSDNKISKSEIDSYSHISIRRPNNYYNRELSPTEVLNKKMKPRANLQRFKMENWKSEYTRAILNSYVPNKKMETVNIRIFEGHQSDL